MVEVRTACLGCLFCFCAEKDVAVDKNFGGLVYDGDCQLGCVNTEGLQQNDATITLRENGCCVVIMTKYYFYFDTLYSCGYTVCVQYRKDTSDITVPKRYE